MSVILIIIGIIIIGIFLESWEKVGAEQEHKQKLKEEKQKKEAAHREQLQQMEREAKRKTLEAEAAQRQRLRDLKYANAQAKIGKGLTNKQIMLWVIAFFAAAGMVLIYLKSSGHSESTAAVPTLNVNAAVTAPPSAAGYRPAPAQPIPSSTVSNPFNGNAQATADTNAEPVHQNDEPVPEDYGTTEDEHAIVEAADARHLIGKYRTVCGQVAQVRKFSKGNYINLGKAYPNQELTVVIWNSSSIVIPELNAHVGKRFCLEGGISSYNGSPQIILSTQEQLK